MNTTTPIKKFELMRSNLETKDLVPADAVHEFLELEADILSQIKAVREALYTYMVDNKIKDLDVLTIAPKTSWNVKGKLAPRFYKQTLNTTKLNSMLKLGEKLPKGVSFTMGSYLTKTNRKAEV